MNEIKGIAPLPTFSCDGDNSRDEFVKEIAGVINKFSVENHSNTPDFILAEYVTKCLEDYATISRWREKWYGKELKIG